MPPKKRENHFLVVRLPAVMNKKESQSYVLDAVRGWRGGFEKDHPLSGSNVSHKKIVVLNTLYDMEKDSLMNLRNEVASVLSGLVVDPPATVFKDVMALFDKYIQRT